MSPVDTAWLRMDRENHLMAIKGVLVLEGRLGLHALAQRLQQRLLPHFPRFTQRVEQDENGAWWVPDPGFDLKHHLRRRRLPRGEPQRALEALVAKLGAEPLEPSRPLWQIELIDPYEKGCALVIRLHHCLADGMALMALMRHLCDGAPSDASDGDGPLGQPVEPPGPQSRSGGQGQAAMQGAMQAHRHGHQPSAESDEAGPDEWFRLLAQWRYNPEAAARVGHLVGLLASDVGKLLVLPPDSETRLKGRTGRRKALSWSHPLPLPVVKAASRALGCSVNDVLLSCVAGALRRHLQAQGDPVAGVNVRTLVPVNVRTPSHRSELAWPLSLPRRGDLGNRFGLVPLLLPLHEGNLLARVQTVSRRMNELKSSMLPPLSLGVLGVMGMAPRAVQGAALELLSSKATAVVTHVPGPRRPRRLAGIPIKEVMFWVPQSGDVGVGVSIFSYADEVRFGLLADAALLPQPQAVMPLLHREFEDLITALLLCADAPLPSAASFENRLRAWAERP